MSQSSVVLFDGVCNFCNGSVQWMIARDKKKRLRFAALQSAAGQKILRRFGLPPEGINSFLFIDNGKLFHRSTAALRVARRLGGVYSFAYLAILVPAALRDAVYNIVATHRYQWFGKRDACIIPTPDVRALFLDDTDE